MAEDVKPLTRRDEKARATRRRILEAAQSRFVEDGYAATTINAIADAADVAVQTVYAVFGNKRTILTELIAYRLGGDDEHVPLVDRAEWRAMEKEADPVAQVEKLAMVAARIGSRLAPLYGVLASASGADADIAAIFQGMQDGRYADQQGVMRRLARRGALRAGLTSAHATDISWAIANPHTYRALVGDRGWSHQNYEQWLARTLREQLLGP